MYGVIVFRKLDTPTVAATASSTTAKMILKFISSPRHGPGVPREGSRRTAAPRASGRRRAPPNCGPCQVLGIKGSGEPPLEPEHAHAQRQQPGEQERETDEHREEAPADHR